MAKDLNSDKEDTNQDRTASEKSGSEKSAPPIRTSFFKDLLSRRVPQIVGGYLAASWIILEFMDWLVKRYPISPHLVEFFLVAIAAMIPTVILLSYYHGKPGRDQWTRVEKIGIPTNLVVTAFLLIFLFQGKDLGGTTTTVSVVDEDGQRIERLIPKSEFRKKVTIFSLENESGDTELDWLVHAIPDMLRYDITQDIYLDIKSVYGMYEDIKEEGYPEAVSIPMTLKKKIAERQYTDYFTSGTFNKQDGQISIQLSLHNTKTTKLLSENQFTGNDIFPLVDDITDWLKNALTIPQMHIEKTEDLPISEILTNSIPALENMYKGFNRIYFEDDWANGLELLEQSVHEDTTFTYAYVHLSLFYILTNQPDKYVNTYQPMMKHLYKLPERLQFGVKHDYYYGVKQEPEMALEVAKNWAELYPDDVRAHTVLAMLYMIRNQKDNELAEYKKILSLDPGHYDLYQKIGNIYKDLGEFADALNYYQLYADEFPNSTKSYKEISELYKVFGDYENARSYCKKALLIEPDEFSVLLSLSDIECELGNFQKALEEYHMILEKCTTAEERSDLYERLENYYFLRGQVKKSTEYVDLKIAELEKFALPIVTLFIQFNALNKYIMVGKNDHAFQVVQTAEEQLGPPLDNNIPFGYLDIYLELEDVENAEKALKEAEAGILSMQGEINRKVILNAQGKINELKGEYEQAIQSYLKQLDLDPTDAAIHVQLGRSYRMQGDPKKAEEHLQKALSIHPFWPDANYEMGLIYSERRKNDESLVYLKKAQSIWENADPGYKPAIKTREKLAELEASNR